MQAFTQDQFERVLLVRYDEIHLKGLNRPFFERRLRDAIRRSLATFGGAQIEHTQSRIFVRGLQETELPAAIARLRLVFGVHSVSPAYAVDVNWESIVAASIRMMDELLQGKGRTSFKVYARRADKRFHLRSDEINRKLGEELLNAFPTLWVDVHHPEIHVGVEVRERSYIYMEEILCAGGMPVGCNGRAALLISGGIDSPVAGYMIARRGVSLCAVHFFSYPYTSERARDKVIELTRLLSQYAEDIRLHLVPFTDIQLAIYENCPKAETTILMRRLMMRIAERIAREENALALITGEAIGQVASQTLESLAATNDAVQLPVFRPLIGYDKNDIIHKAKEIGTFETSILPYEDCCTVFVPQHPVTKPEIERIRKSEELVDFTDMVEQAMQKREILCVKFEGIS